MSKDKIMMLIVTIISALCVVWAINVKAPVMAVLLVFNTLFSLYVLAFKLKDKDN